MNKALRMQSEQLSFVCLLVFSLLVEKKKYNGVTGFKQEQINHNTKQSYRFAQSYQHYMVFCLVLFTVMYHIVPFLEKKNLINFFIKENTDC